MNSKPKILLYGYGNPGRQDDGLGKALIDTAQEWVSEEQLPYVSLDVNYQLQVEDVTQIHDKDLVIFVDASMEESVRDYLLIPVAADEQVTFSMHAISPAYLLALYSTIYGQHPPAYIMHIRGYEWKFNEALTQAAHQNMLSAWNALKGILYEPGILLDEDRTLYSGIH